MTTYENILARQEEWARRHGIALEGSKGDSGRPMYVKDLNDNLFQPLLPATSESFGKGDGSETKDGPESRAKMKAVHSSSALGVNVFEYWQRVNQIRVIAAACGFCDDMDGNPNKIEFEKKYEIDKAFPRKPNIDIVIHNEGGKTRVFAVECKFTEAYSPWGHSGIAARYLDRGNIWDGIPGTLELARTISPNDTRFRYLHTAQLVKHILALKREFGKEGFRLLYLWYDAPGEEEGGLHRKETAEFSEVITSDGVRFHSMSFQELFKSLSREHRSSHRAYIDYISDRYL